MLRGFFSTPFSTFIRGGQTTVHEAKMLLQTIRQTAFTGTIIMLVFAGWQVYDETTTKDREVLKTYVVGSVFAAFKGPEAKVVFQNDDGKKYQVYATKFIKSDMAKKSWEKARDAAIFGFLLGLGLSSIIVLIIMLFFYGVGRKQGSDFYIRGSQMGTIGELAAKFRKMGRKGTISLGGVRIPAELEPTSLALVGAPRTGKSVQTKSICKEIREAGQRAIIYDFDGLYTQLFYRPGKDIILNPTDERSVEWRPWYDATDPTHFEQQAASLVPDHNSADDFWPKAARTVFVALCRKLERVLEDPSLKDLLLWGLRTDAETVQKFLAGTEASAAFAKEKTADNIMSHLATYLKSFNYLRTTGKPFSIREWVEDEKDDSWLFISVQPSQIDAMRPLITLWLDIASSAILSLPEDRKRRFWYIFDELYTVNKIPSLLTTLTNAPKYGGCGIIGYQNQPLLKTNWGQDGAEALIGACATQCIFRAQDTTTSKWAEELLGETEQAETNEGVSYGATDLRDGRTANIHRSRGPLVLASEVRALDNLNYFLNAGRGLPVVPIKLKYKAYQEVAETYIPRADKRLIVDIDDMPLPDQEEIEEPTFTPVPMPKEKKKKQVAESTEVPLLEGVLPPDEQQSTSKPKSNGKGKKEKAVTSALEENRASEMAFLDRHFGGSSRKS